MEFRELTTKDEIQDFYNLLEINLSKYSLKLIHTVDEIWDFHYKRLKKETKFVGVYKDGKQMAGGCRRKIRELF